MQDINDKKMSFDCAAPVKIMRNYYDCANQVFTFYLAAFSHIF